MEVRASLKKLMLLAIFARVFGVNVIKEKKNNLILNHTNNMELIRWTILAAI
jgi:hypothetical protein